jgi:RNA polymerase sigma-70 factor (family 1)
LAIRAVHNEKALLEAVSRGEETAFAELFHAYHQPLAEFILKVTHSLSWTEDIVQDVFIKVWLKKEELPGLNSFTNWLFILCRNYTLHCLKRKTAELTRQHDWSLQAGEEQTFPEPEQPGDHYRALIAAAVDRLPPQQQKVWRLSREQQLTYNQIAGEMQIAPSTVKSHMQAALMSVRTYVRGHIDPALLAILLSPIFLR